MLSCQHGQWRRRQYGGGGGAGRGADAMSPAPAAGRAFDHTCTSLCSPLQAPKHPKTRTAAQILFAAAGPHRPLSFPIATAWPSGTCLVHTSSSSTPVCRRSLEVGRSGIARAALLSTRPPATAMRRAGARRAGRPTDHSRTRLLCLKVGNAPESRGVGRCWSCRAAIDAAGTWQASSPPLAPPPARCSPPGSRRCRCLSASPPELGIDIPAILSRTRSILTFRLAGHDMDHLDLGGPLILMALLGFAHLLVRRHVLAGDRRGVRGGAAWRLFGGQQHSGTRLVCRLVGARLMMELLLPHLTESSCWRVAAGRQDAFRIHPGLDGGGIHAAVVSRRATPPAAPRAAALPPLHASRCSGSRAAAQRARADCRSNRVLPAPGIHRACWLTLPCVAYESPHIPRMRVALPHPHPRAAGLCSTASRGRRTPRPSLWTCTAAPACWDTRCCRWWPTPSWPSPSRGEQAGGREPSTGACVARVWGGSPAAGELLQVCRACACRWPASTAKAGSHARSPSALGSCC